MRAAATIVVLVAIAAGVVWLVRAYLAAQKERMRAVAAAAGLEVDVSSKRPPPIGFDLFDDGSSRKVRPQMWRAGEPDSVFQYEYTVKSGESSRTYRFTAALVELPFSAPHLTISTETWWSRAKRVVGLRDIEIESPDFNDRYHVRCRDQRFAVALLDPPMIGWMLSPSSGQGTVTFEFLGHWMLYHCDQLALEQLPPMLTWAQAARARLPVVLTELYGG